MSKIGARRWAVSCGHIPLASTGAEPRNTSRDELCVLNATDAAAAIELTIFHADRDPVGPYEFTVAARRVRHLRFNDLIDPEAVPLDTPFACIVEASVPIVVQFSRVDTGSGATTIALASAIPG